ncbi:ATP-binding cassette domain-containing protein [Microbacterium sp. Au-Mic1]|uniref:ABC transporter ATP-binding protein n=1 Tax=Microbacterium sp. Au-Mic1 TaxID=2906457 RepID=UPI001E42B58F|nr:ATP-binding cassette domain-containing protein [Microbacterium sp. Au-Mic1]MCE4026556.1 ATP-binding cassette domain-containing protein [Microbacterium sp. Au-Mic1]
MSAEVVRLDRVSLRRDGRDILHEIGLTVHAGEHWALLGPNGAGKSTILGICGARTHPSSGTAEVLGHRIGRVDLQELRHRIGHVDPRHPLRSPLTVTEVVLTGLTGTIETPMRWGPTPAQTALAQQLIVDVGLSHRRDALWPTLSQGERGRALIARALACRPRLLLLDEPMTGLDVAAREQLLETIDALAHRDPRLASILVTHHLEDLPETTSHALVIEGGAIAAIGAIEAAVTTETISRAFAHPIEVTRTGGRWAARTRRDRRAAVPA